MVNAPATFCKHVVVLLEPLRQLLPHLQFSSAKHAVPLKGTSCQWFEDANKSG